MRIEETRDKLIAAALAHVPFDGWSAQALRAGAADLGVDQSNLLTMRFDQQRCTIRRMIAVNLRIGYSLCSMRPARGYTSSSCRLGAVTDPTRKMTS